MLPQWLDPRKLAQQGARFHGEVAPENLPQLRQAVERLGSVSATLTFAVNESGLPTLEGVLAVDLGTVCQRCLAPIEQTLSATLAVGVVADDEGAEGLPERLDPWVVGMEMGDLYALIEEELLLALPMIPVHPPGECADVDVYMYVSGEAAQAPRRNPFDILRQLKISD